MSRFAELYAASQAAAEHIAPPAGLPILWQEYVFVYALQAFDQALASRRRR